MRFQTIDATVEDPLHLRLQRPLALPAGSVVRVVVADDDDRTAALDAAARLLADTYGPNEPEYTEADIKVLNPKYRP